MIQLFTRNLNLASILLLINIGVEIGNLTIGRLSQFLSKLIIQLGPNTTRPRGQHLVTKFSVGPVVPADQRAAVEDTKGVLNTVAIVLVGETEAVRESTVFVVYNQGFAVLKREPFIGLVAVALVARCSDSNNVITSREDNNILPVVLVARQETRGVCLVFFEIVLIHDSTNTIVAALARVDVAVLKLMGVTAITLRSACGILSRVGVAVWVDGSCVIATIRVKVKKWLKLELDIVSAFRERCQDVTSPQGCRRGVDESQGAQKSSS